MLLAVDYKHAMCPVLSLLKAVSYRQQQLNPIHFRLDVELVRLADSSRGVCSSLSPSLIAGLQGVSFM